MQAVILTENRNIIMLERKYIHIVFSLCFECWVCIIALFKHFRTLFIL